MATIPGKARCIICEKEKSAVRCEGCLQIFCRIHLNDHSQQLSQQFDEIEVNRDLFRQTLNEQMNQQQEHVLIKQIDKWEFDSIEIIKQTANECREKFLQQTNEHFNQMEINLTKLTNQMREIRQENDFNETDLNYLKQKLKELEKQLDQIQNVSIQEDSTTLVKKLSIVISSGEILSSASSINSNKKWKQNGATIAGGNWQGNEFDQLYYPAGIYVYDDDQCIYVVDDYNHRIVEWKYGAKMGQIVAGGNAYGNRMNQLNHPTDVIVDKTTDSLIICDNGNKRVVRWPRRNGTNGQTIISDIDCASLAMDNNGDLYVSNWKKNEVRKWKIGEKKGTVVAGGNGEGNKLSQFAGPSFLFVDEDQSVYVSDTSNHRVMKWVKDAKEGIVVAGGQGKGNSLIQLNYPQGVIVDHLGDVYVADSYNQRIMCWSKGSNEGRVIVGGNGKGQESNQFNYLRGLSFDQQGHLIVADNENNRIQKFLIDLCD